MDIQSSSRDSGLGALHEDVGTRKISTIIEHGIVGTKDTQRILNIMTMYMYTIDITIDTIRMGINWFYAFMHFCVIGTLS